MSAGMKIGDLAKSTLCPVATVRYYEREGLLPAPARSSGNYRMYGPKHVEALRFIRHCRSLDMTRSDQAGSLLNSGCPKPTASPVSTRISTIRPDFSARI